MTGSHRRFALVRGLPALLTAAVLFAAGSVALAGADDPDAPLLLPIADPVVMDPPFEALSAEAARRLPEAEIERRLATGTSLVLRAGSFDPIEELPPAFLAGVARLGRPAGDEGVFLVQMKSEISEADRRSLEAAGVHMLDRVPGRGFVVRADRAAFAALAGSGLVRWADAFRAEYKLAPMLDFDGWKGPVYLDARLLPGENPMLLLERLRAFGPGVRLSGVHGRIEDGAILRLIAPRGQVGAIARRAAEDAATWTVEPWFQPRIQNNHSIWVIQSYDTTNKLTYSLSATLWNHGITGTGQTPAIADTGLDDDMCFFRNSSSASDIVNSQSPALPGTGTIDPTKKVIAYYVMPGATSYDGNTLCSGVPESYHGTHVTGSVAGDNFLTLSTPTSGGHDPGDGMAPNAKVIFQDIGSEASGCLDGLINDYNLIWQQAYDAGARVHSNSWGGAVNGAYTSDAMVVDHIAYGHEDMLLLFSNGNNGPVSQTVGSPATAKNVVSVGALSNGSAGSNSIASFSSRGPTADGRRKPDISAPGQTIVSASGDVNHSSNNCSTKTLDGTSMATPTVAGGVTLLRQYFTDGFYPTGAKAAADALIPSAALMKSALVNGAVDVANTTQATMQNSINPNTAQGFGRIALDPVAFFSTPTRDTRRTRVWDKLNAVGLVTGQQDDYLLTVVAGQPLKVSLVWTDPESSGLSGAQLINNLDLEVIDPSANVYRGNVISSGQSTTGGTADLLNNVELVFLKTPAAGTWTLRVKAPSVPGTPGQPYSTRQGYALVATYADCTSTLAAATGVTATNTGTSVSVTWNAVAGAARYQVYRATGGCASPAGQFRFVGQAAGTSFNDTLVQGGYTYAYKIRAVTNCTEGPLSACSSAAYTGNCTLVPNFSGISSTTNDLGTPACDGVLGWTAGTSNCPLGPTTTHDIYRSTSPTFVPGAGTLVASGVPGSSYTDTTTSGNVTYDYTVRAEDGTTANGGPANGGNVDVNRRILSLTPTAASSFPGTWSDDGGDTTGRLGLSIPWQISTQQNHTAGGAFAYHSGPDGSIYPANFCAPLTSPPIPLQAAGTPTLSYWVRYDLEYQWDGVVVEISTNGGGSWTPMAPTPPYPANLSLTGVIPINACNYPASQGAFTGPNPNGTLTPWTQYSHNLSAYLGQTVQIRWRLTTDPGVEYEGFYLDDIQLTQAFTPKSCGTDLRLVSNTLSADTCVSGGAGNLNGVLEAGEDATIAVSLQNIGETGATAVTGTLSTTAPGVVVTRPNATFPSIATTASASSIAPHFGIWVAPNVPCGTVVTFTLQLTSAQGTWTRSFTRLVGSSPTGCTQTVCTGAIPVEDGTATARLKATKGAGTVVNLTYSVSCHASDTVVYWGFAAGHMTGITWTNAACGLGPSGTGSFNPGTPAPGSVIYFVVVPNNGALEGSYGRNSANVQRPQATGLGTCDLPQNLTGTCP